MKYCKKINYINYLVTNFKRMCAFQNDLGKIKSFWSTSVSCFLAILFCYESLVEEGSRGSERKKKSKNLPFEHRGSFSSSCLFFNICVMDTWQMIIGCKSCKSIDNQKISMEFLQSYIKVLWVTLRSFLLANAEDTVIVI